MIRIPCEDTRRLTKRLSLSTQKRWACRFGRKRRRVLLLACDTLFPVAGRFPVTWQILDIAPISNRQNRDLESLWTFKSQYRTTGYFADTEQSNHQDPNLKSIPPRIRGVRRISCLAMTDFSVSRSHTIIGAARFHGRVRDGIEWFPRAKVARRKGVEGTMHAKGGGSHILWVLQGQAARSISTGRLHTLPRVHRPPIHVVVSNGPSGVSRTREI